MWRGGSKNNSLEVNIMVISSEFTVWICVKYSKWSNGSYKTRQVIYFFAIICSLLQKYNTIYESVLRKIQTENACVLVTLCCCWILVSNQQSVCHLAALLTFWFPIAQVISIMFTLLPLWPQSSCRVVRVGVSDIKKKAHVWSLSFASIKNGTNAVEASLPFTLQRM